MNWPLQLPATQISLSPGIQAELNGLILGEKLGEGAFRTVYACAIDPRVVVKVESTVSGRFCNIDEWNLWAEVRGRPEIARWFAPVRYVSSCGSFLVMDRTQPLTRLPKQVPNFMADIKLANMGKLGGRPVFHDYANTHVEALAMRRFKLVERS